MCISYHEIESVATAEEKEILLNPETGMFKIYRYSWNTPEYHAWYRVYDSVQSTYYERKAQQRREAKRLRQEKELQEKERELFKAAQSLGLQLQPSSCRIKYNREVEELLHT